jgi:hypothetical protein
MSTVLSWVGRGKLFWFFSVGLCVGKNQMCLTVRLAKIVFKKCAVGKKEKT